MPAAGGKPPKPPPHPAQSFCHALPMEVGLQVVIEEGYAVCVLQQVASFIASGFVQADEPAGFLFHFLVYPRFSKNTGGHSGAHRRMHGFEFVVIVEVLTSEPIWSRSLDIMSQRCQSQRSVCFGVEMKQPFQSVFGMAWIFRNVGQA